MSRRIAVVLLLGLLTGCMAKLSYSFADWIIEWTVADYVSLDKVQKKQLKLDIDRQLEWHQQTQLKLYRDWLIEFREQADRGLNRKWLLTWSEQTGFFWQAILRQITPNAITLLESLSDHQVEQLIATLNKKQSELEKQYLSPDRQKRLQQRQRRTVEFIDRLLGKLNDQQKALIVDWSTLSEDSTVLWLQNREQWTRGFEQVLQNRNSEQFAGQITQLFVYPRQLWSESYSQSMAENVQYSVNLALAIEPTVSEKQRNKLTKFLDRLIAVLDNLAHKKLPPEARG